MEIPDIQQKLIPNPEIEDSKIESNSREGRVYDVIATRHSSASIRPSEPSPL